MDEALDLARQGIGRTSPNPAVGAVLVRDGRVAGRGSHTWAGVKHAEILALEQAGPQARGADLYITLEPCSHTGRTGPCAAALIQAGIKRVIAAMEDPNPSVSGSGFEKLREAGIAVELANEYEAAAARINEGFVHAMRTGRPLVTLKAAMSLDGKIGAEPGDTGWITSAQARAHAQHLRHESDAVITGIGTVLADNPLLTDRTGLERSRPLLRIVLDSTLRTPPDSRIVESSDRDLIIAAKPGAPTERKRALAERGIRVCEFESLASLLDCLGREQYRSVLIEAGASVNGSALDDGLVDKVFLYYGAKIIGGAAVPLSAGRTRSRERAIAFERVTVHPIEPDEFAVEAYVHRDH